MLKHNRNSLDVRIDRVVQGLRMPVTVKDRPAVRGTLAERMRVLNVPGISIAIINGWQVVWAEGYGSKETGTTESVTASTLFQAASISKPVTATATLRLVEDGKLSLDEDVNTYLKSWKVPENSFTGQEKVTLRRILSHSAGFTISGFPGYKSGEPIPTLQQILDGDKPANTSAIKVDVIPGSLSQYSGGGFTVLQQLLTDVTGEPFPSLLRRLVLNPAGMTLSTCEHLLPELRRKEAASGHDAEGAVVKGKWHIYPEMAAAGLWSTPTELARWTLEISRAWSGQRSKLLSESMAHQMLTFQTPLWGLGVNLEGTDNAMRFTHEGTNQGFRAMFVMYPVAGKGAVVMTNANLGRTLYGEVLQSIGDEYQWPTGA